ncbi:MAG: hypothetical protein M3R26_04915 [Actinomycetota bacterium]|nr:hypothetical protein [Actinomycetota bacterium]
MAIPSEEAKASLSSYHFECHAFVARKLRILANEVVLRVGAKEIQPGLTNTRVESVVP